MRRFALIGKKLGHSYSQRWFEDLFAREGLKDHSYRLEEMASLEGLREWVRREDIDGFNVTVPYKRDVIAQLDALDETAAAIGAVNCVTVDGGRLIGHNTDAPAFRQTIQDSGFRIQNSFILGTGGAAHAVAYALNELGIPYAFVSRAPGQHPDAIGYEQLLTLSPQDSTLIVNATPVGMYPDVDATPLDIIHVFTCSPIHAFVYDLIYNPTPTRLMREAAAAGAQVKDGLEMLHLQAEYSWHLFRQK
jgi:shikimate dehydrogenase